MRAYLTVSAATLDAVADCGADAWILDPAVEGTALSARGGPPILLRLGGVAVLADGLPPLPRPAAILLAVAHGRDVAHAGARLAVHEARHGWPDGATRIVALVADAAAALTLASLPGSSPRLAGIGWDAASLAAELGVAATDGAGAWIAPLAQVRALARLAAAAARVEAVETACPPGIEPDSHACAALRDGFGAVVAHSPAEVAAIRSAGS